MIIYKKIGRLFFVSVILLLTLTITAFSYYNTRETAIEIAPNALVEGCSYEGGSPHWYKFDVPADGYISVEFDHVPFDEEYRGDRPEFWAINLYDSKGVDIHEHWIVFHKDTTENTTDNVGVSAGTYYIAIYGLKSYGDVPYTFTINYNSADNWEVEGNNKAENANLISVNKKYNGSLSYNYYENEIMTAFNSFDEDWYYFTISEDGKVNIEFNHDITSSSTNCWQLALYSLDVSHSTEYLLGLVIIGEGSNAWVWDDYSYFFPGNENGVTCSYGLSAGTYYLRIAKPTDAPYEGKAYDFKINYEVADDWEDENRGGKAPNSVELGNTYKGAVITENDNDWYEFELDSKRDVTIEFNHEVLDTNEKCWKVTLYNGRWHTASEVISFESNGNNPSTSSCKITCEEGIYSLVIEKSDSFSSADYSFTISENESGETIDVNVPVSSLRIESLPDKLAYTVGEEYDYTGLKVVATFSDGQTRDVTDLVTITTKSDSLSYADDKDIIATVSYKDKIATFHMGLTDYPIIEIDITNGFVKSDYAKWGVWYKFKIPSEEYCSQAKFQDLVVVNNLNTRLDVSICKNPGQLYKFMGDFFRLEESLNQPSVGLNSSSANKFTINYSDLEPDTWYYMTWRFWSSIDEDAYYTLDFTRDHEKYPGTYRSVVTKEPTCTSYGYEDRYCYICDDKIGTEYLIDKKDCKFGDWYVKTEPTNTRYGFEARVCEACGKEETRKIYMEHGKYGEWKTTKEPSCEASGEKAFICKCCNKTTETVVLTKLAHKYEKWSVIKEATCNEKGEKASVCSLCNKQKKTETIPKLNHQYTDWTEEIRALPERNGKFVKVCSLCNDKEEKIEKYSLSSLKSKKKIKPNFKDVDEKAWYKDVVDNCYHYSLMMGNSENTFNPTGNITLAEVITTAVRIWCLNNSSYAKPQLGTTPWYQAYVDYAIKMNIISKDDFDDYTRPATRAEMAYILRNSVTSTNLIKLNTIKEIPDVKKEDKYGEEIFKLYEAGVLGGSDEKGTFYPDKNITRAEGAAIIARLSKISDRIKK